MTMRMIPTASATKRGVTAISALAPCASLSRAVDLCEFADINRLRVVEQHIADTAKSFLNRL